MALVFIVGGCMEEELGISGEENIVLNSMADSPNAKDPPYNKLHEDCNPHIVGIIAGMYENPLGRKLIDAINIKEKIRFIDNMVPKGRMEYVGKGVVLMNINGMAEKDIVQLVFHELFHIYQNGSVIKKIRNNEVEAYLAQYIFMQTLGKEMSGVSGNFKNAIGQLALHVDVNAGRIKNPALFQQHYLMALTLLRQNSLYNGMGWGEEPAPYDIDNFINMLK